MQRRQRYERFEFSQDCGIDAHRRSEFLAAMDDAVPDGGKRLLTLVLSHEREHVCDGARMPERIAVGPVALLHDAVLRVAGREGRRGGKTLDLPAQQPTRSGGVAGVQGEFQARRSRVQHQDRAGRRHYCQGRR